MTPLDIAKALALAVVILAIEFALSYPIAWTFYPDDDAMRWCLYIAGSPIFFLAGWLFTGRVRHRNAYAFIAATCGWYLLIEFANTFPYGGFHQFLGAWTWMTVQFAAAFAGVVVARRTLPPAEQPTI